jgi:beta-galactosidase
MTYKTYLLSLTLLLSGLLPALAQKRTCQSLQEDWRFHLGAATYAEQPNFDDSDWEAVRVPHDWAIGQPFEVDGDGSTGKLPWKGQGWYRRSLDIPASDSDKSHYLIFDGVMAFPKVYVNGELAGTWDYGYNSFYLDITDLVKPGGSNVLAVHSDTREHDSRWYPGAGIYRKVQLLTTDPIHVDVWGDYVITPIVKPHYADVRVRSTINNYSNLETDVQVIHEIVSPDDIIITRDTIERTIRAGQQGKLENTLVIPDPLRWDVEHPHLYTMRTRVVANGRERDRTNTKFGVRTIRFTPDDGFWLNDRRVQLKGVNLHHDHGPLGAAFYPRAMERQLEIMKSLGVNSVRNSHNTAAPEFLALCDSMGLLVFNEVFDKYDGKAGITDDTDFEEFTHRNIRNFVVRDRNHPSIFLWSVGNEIGDVQWNINNGFYRLQTMLNYVNKYDPTRPVTLVNDNVDAPKLRHFDLYDVHAFNYGRRYRLARQMEPNKSVVISESASTLSTRGFYELPLPEKPTNFTDALQVSSYDLLAPWWAEVADDDFMWQQEEPYIAGEFVWTGFDYLGEPTPYGNRSVNTMGMTDEDASRSSYFGIVDLVGIPKDRYYLYKSYWKPEEPTVHILPHWNWPERTEENVPVFVYTNGDCAELFLNGESLGMKCKQPKADSSIFRFRLMWTDVTYEPGELTAVAYKASQQIGKQTMVTAGEPTQLRLSPDRSKLDASGMDLSYVLVEALDAEGNPAPLADHEVQIEVEGAGVLAGAGNGNPQSFEPFQNDTVNLFYGKAMLIVRAGQEGGPINVRVSADGLGSDSVRLVVGY